MFKLIDFFNEKGKIYTRDEYKALEDAPIKELLVRRYYGTWNRVMNMANKMCDLKVAEVKVEEEEVATKAPVTKPVTKMTVK